PDPGAVLGELQRVAPRGYIETPSAEFEKAWGFPFHRWMVSLKDGVLHFFEKERPYFDLELREWFARMNERLQTGDRMWFARRQIGIYTCLQWEETIRFEVHRSGKATDFTHAEVGHCDESLGAQPRGGLASRYIDRRARAVRRRSDLT